MTSATYMLTVHPEQLNSIGANIDLRSWITSGVSGFDRGDSFELGGQCSGETQQPSSGTMAGDVFYSCIMI